MAQYEDQFVQIERTLTQIQGQLGRMEEHLSYTPTKAEFTEFTSEIRRDFSSLEARLTRWILAMAALGGFVGSVLTMAAKLMKIVP